MENAKYDVVMIGGGPGGYVAAIRAAQLGLKTLVVEKDKLGGVCLNWGCIPTKALLKNAEVYNLLKHADEFGFSFDNLKADFSKAVKRSRDIALRSSKGIEFLFKKNKVDYLPGTATVTAPGSIQVEQPGKKSIISAKHIILATGARPRAIPGIKIDGKNVITSSEAMVLPEPPKSMIIIGAGAIGVEFAYFYNAYGTKVTVVEMLPSILPIEDREVTKTLGRVFAKAGITVMTETKVDSVVSGKSVKVTVSGKEGTKELEADVALVAIGVQGNIEGLGLETLGVKTEKSFITVDANYRTNVEGLYAIGDVNGPPWLAHVASAEGVACVDAIAGKKPHPINYDNIPGCTYCQPQVASIGLTEEKAREKGHELKIGRFPFRSHGKALAMNETEGFVKLIFDAKYGELLGAHIIGAEATEMIGELAVARTLETTYEQIVHTIHAHPTLTEGIAEAALDAYGEAINI
ncbi:MAG: dihydrolipoyl dehydrogenase [Ignavibacteriales bacterium]|nr:dihydrolipoyl dehydrogenase [Ignavibacteriales bacterium]